jgi:hypothetical protein
VEQRYFSDTAVLVWACWAVSALLFVAACLAWFSFEHMGWTMILGSAESITTGVAVVAHVRGYAMQLCGRIGLLAEAQRVEGGPVRPMR